MKQLAEQAENERLVSRGKILESFLKEPLVLTNDDVAHLLDLLFRSLMAAYGKYGTPEREKHPNKWDKSTVRGILRNPILLDLRPLQQGC